MKFHVLPRGTKIPDSGRNSIYLTIDHWNDYSFVTMFGMSLHDEQGKLHEIGAVKIGFKGQTTEISTYKTLPHPFEGLGDEYFSLGGDVDYYRNMATLPNNLGMQVLNALRDIVASPEIIEGIKDEDVFSTSLLRYISLSVIKGQFSRVLQGQAELTDYKFKFVRPDRENFGGIELNFAVEAASTPITNIHAVIGRNGVGKTTLLNGMIGAITGNQDDYSGRFIDTAGLQLVETEITNDYFSSLVSVSFSAFDPFSPPKEQPDPAKGTCYYYIGLKDQENKDVNRTIIDLRQDCVKALISCFRTPKKTKRWLEAIDKLGSDEIFASMKLEQLETFYRELRKTMAGEQSDSSNFRNNYQELVEGFLRRMSSGHACVLLIITRLVATVEEKTLVLIDEPESHLHPPLLSAFTRALSDLLYDQNGVAIIATHSPVVLQEIPKSCVWKIYRIGSNVTEERPTIETFGENVGLLTSEVFSLEVERSGFHDLLAQSVESGKNYNEIIQDYNDQLGFEGRAILKALIANRDRSINNDATE